MILSSRTTRQRPILIDHAELHGYAWCPEGDLNPHDRFGSADFKSAVSADFTIRAQNKGADSAA